MRLVVILDENERLLDDVSLEKFCTELQNNTTVKVSFCSVEDFNIFVQQSESVITVIAFSFGVLCKVSLQQRPVQALVLTSTSEPIAQASALSRYYNTLGSEGIISVLNVVKSMPSIQLQVWSAVGYWQNAASDLIQLKAKNTWFEHLAKKCAELIGNNLGHKGSGDWDLKALLPVLAEESSQQIKSVLQLRTQMGDINNDLEIEKAKVSKLNVEMQRLSYRLMVSARYVLYRHFHPLLKLIYRLVKWYIASREEISGLRTKTRAKLRLKIWTKPNFCPIDGPLVSIVIPCFNYGAYVLEALNSINQQTLKNVEIVIVDGGSTDAKTINVLRGISQANVKVYFRTGRHLVGDNRNFGIQQTVGKYICCLDADDLLRPTYLETAIYLMESKNLDLVSCSVESFGKSKDVWIVPQYPTLSRAKVENVCSTVAVFKRDLWVRAGGYHDFGIGKNHIHEDWCLWQRFLILGARAQNIMSPLMKYRVHSSESLSKQNGVVPNIDRQREAINEFNSPAYSFAAFMRRSAIHFFEYRPKFNGDAIFSTATNAKVVMVFDIRASLLDSKFIDLLEAWQSDPNYIVVSLWGRFLPCKLDRIFFLEDFIGASDYPDFFSYLQQIRNAQFLSWDVRTDEIGIGKTAFKNIANMEGKSNKRIVVAVPWLDFGGSSVLLNMIFTRLKDIGYQITVVASNPDNEMTAERGLRLYTEFSEDIVSLPFAAKNKSEAIESIVIARSADILMIVGSDAAYRCLPNLKHRCPDIKVIDHLYNPFGHIARNKKYRKWIDFNIAANEDVEKAIVSNGFDPGKVTVIHHGVQIKAPIVKDRVRGQSQIVFGFLGRLSQEKRPIDFIKMAKQLPEHKFIMAGDGPMMQACRDSISVEKVMNCQILGFVEDLNQFWQDIDVLVLTSEIEGLPLVLLEAMNYEMPVMASAVGHIPRLISHGKNGFLFESGDIAALVNLARSYSAMAYEVQDEIGRAARQTVISEYSVDVCANKYDQIFSSSCPLTQVT